MSATTLISNLFLKHVTDKILRFPPLQVRKIYKHKWQQDLTLTQHSSLSFPASEDASIIYGAGSEYLFFAHTCKLT